jgi:hypothetical protein
VNSVVTDDQLSHFMTKAMTLDSLSAPKVGSFVGCTARFNGTRSEQELQTFVLNVMLYKDAEGVDDETALKELPLLMEGEAATWWAGIKENICNWSEALKMLQKAFFPPKPAYQIYTEIFATKQDEYIPTEIFIQQKLALLDALPRPHPEDVKIDMIYSLLKPKIHRKVPRESIVTLGQLIAAGNRVDHKKDKKRVKRFVNFNFETMKPAAKSKEKCSHCRKSKGSKVDCYKCNALRRKLDEDPRQYIPLEAMNPVNVTPLRGFNPDSNPFRK